MSHNKHIYLRSLSLAKQTFDNYQQVDEEGYLTYITSAGLICGRVLDLKKIDSASNETFYDDLRKYMGEDGLDLLSMTSAVHKRLLTIERDQTEKEIKGTSLSIPLTDVQIKTANGIINVNQFVIFVDQIVGVLPGKIDLSDL